MSRLKRKSHVLKKKHEQRSYDSDEERYRLCYSSTDPCNDLSFSFNYTYYAEREISLSVARILILSEFSRWCNQQTKRCCEKFDWIRISNADYFDCFEITVFAGL